MSLFLAIIGAIAAIFSIIIVHELGHYFVARACGIKILRFSIGFGKAIWTRQGKSGTEFRVAILPLGGYVKMLGEGEEVTSPEDAHRAFNQKPLLSRMAVVTAGPITNFLIAVIAYWGVYLIGVTHTKPIVGRVAPQSIAARAGVKPGDQLLKVGAVETQSWQRALMAIIMRMGDHGQLKLTVLPAGAKQPATRMLNLASWSTDQRNPAFFQSLGLFPYHPKISPIISRVLPDSPAARAGLSQGDRVLALNGKTLDDWAQIVGRIKTLPGKTVSLTILRNGQKRTIPVTIGSVKKQGRESGYLGVMSVPAQWPKQYLYQSDYNVLTAWWPALQQTWTLTAFNFMVVVKMITGKISIHTLGGPITVFQAAGKATEAGLQVYLSFIGFISLTIGFINLLPIPGLDGGHLLFQVIEAIIRRPVPERVQMVGLSIGMVFLVFLIVQATINDLLRIFFNA